MSGVIEIVRWNKKYKDDFVKLNKEWIEQYFHLEDCDLKILSDPEAEIINKGGEIFFAITDSKVAGCCALIHHPEDGRYELGKMAVSPLMQGSGIGYQLGKALIDHARDKEISSLFLEANTKLEASVRLYYKLGFEAKKTNSVAYGRCNLYMEIQLIEEK